MFYIYTLLFCIAANGWLIMRAHGGAIPVLIVAMLVALIFSGWSGNKKLGKRLRICLHGIAGLKMFVCSVIASVICHIFLAVYLLPFRVGDLALSIMLCVAALSLLFWQGIICVYISSYQLGIKQRILGILFGFVPIINVIMLVSIITTVSEEMRFEINKARINEERAAERVCGTKYPILLVHGVFFRDFRYFNYWGRIPEELQKNGATVFYGNHQSAASVAENARELACRIRQITENEGYEKVNIIAHSKGGLDSVYAVCKCGVADKVASVTTVNTPHKGCEFADFLLEKIPEKAQRKIADTYNKALKRLGDRSPDFMAAVRDLTAKGCAEVMGDLQLPEGVYTRGYGSRLNNAVSGKFPLNFTYHLVKHFDGANDGLVSVSSCRWGEDFSMLTTFSKRGISHGDVIDLNRENIKGFDVREFYVEAVSELKKRGL